MYACNIQKSQRSPTKLLEKAIKVWLDEISLALNITTKFQKDQRYVSLDIQDKLQIWFARCLFTRTKLLLQRILHVEHAI